MKFLSTIRNNGFVGAMKSIPSQFRGIKRERNLIKLKKNLYKPNKQHRYLNLGGSNWYYPRWENIDLYADSLFVDYNIDFRENIPIPLPDNCARLVFTSHLLEHLCDEACKFNLNECYRLLHSNGVIRISVPDMDKAFKAYRKKDEYFFSNGGVTVIGDTIERKLVNFFASYSKKGYSGGPIVPTEEIRDKIKTLHKYDFLLWCVSQIPADATYKAHVNGYDFEKLHKLLKLVGFSKVIKSSYRNSIVPLLRKEAFDNRPMVSLFVEAIK